MLEKSRLKITYSYKMIVLFRIPKQLPINAMVKLKQLICYVLLISTLDSHQKIAQNYQLLEEKQDCKITKKDLL